MSTRFIRILKPFIFLLGMAPALLLVHRFRTDNLGSDPVAYLTHFTGDWAVYFLSIGLAVTPIRRLSVKLGWMVRFRRMIGLFAFFYATLHLLTYVFLFSGFDIAGAVANIRTHDLVALRQKWLDIWPTMISDIQKRRFIQVGLFAWLLLLALAVTSPQWVMRKMGGRPWQMLHRAVYGASALAIVHYWWLVKRGNLEPLTDTLILLLLLVARPIWSIYQRHRKPRPVVASIRTASPS